MVTVAQTGSVLCCPLLVKPSTVADGSLIKQHLKMFMCQTNVNIYRINMSVRFYVRFEEVQSCCVVSGWSDLIQHWRFLRFTPRLITLCFLKQVYLCHSSPPPTPFLLFILYHLPHCCQVTGLCHGSVSDRQLSDNGSLIFVRKQE